MADRAEGTGDVAGEAADVGALGDVGSEGDLIKSSPERGGAARRVVEGVGVSSRPLHHGFAAVPLPVPGRI